MASPEPLLDEKQKKINEIIDDIFKLDSPRIDNSRRNQISDFIKSAVNGDTPLDHLAINVNLGENVKGTNVYVLTNLRLIKIDIGNNNHEIQSTSFPLKTIIGIERNLTKDGKIEFAIIFQNGSIGLRYSPEDSKITNFFQRIDQRGVI